MNKAVFLDRDGVINKKPRMHDYAKSWEEFELLPTVIEALKYVKSLGYIVVVVTNQRGVSRGLVEETTVDDIHNKLNSILKKHGAGVDAFYFCPHDYEDKCDCRKPAPGLILQAAKELDIDLRQSILIGDTKEDMQCGTAAGVKTYLMDTDADLLQVVKSVLK